MSCRFGGRRRDLVVVFFFWGGGRGLLCMLEDGIPEEERKKERKKGVAVRLLHSGCLKKCENELIFDLYLSRLVVEMISDNPLVLAVYPTGIEAFLPSCLFPSPPDVYSE